MSRSTKLSSAGAATAVAAAMVVLALSAAGAQNQRNAPANPRPGSNAPTSAAPTLQSSALNLSEIKVFHAGKVQPLQPGPPDGAHPPAVRSLNPEELAEAKKHIFKPLIPRSSPGATGAPAGGATTINPTQFTLTPMQANNPGRAWLRFDNVSTMEFEPSVMATLRTVYIRLMVDPHQIHMFDVFVATPDNPAAEFIGGKCIYTVTGPDSQVQLIPCSADHSKIQHLLFGMESGDTKGQQTIKIEAPVYWYFAKVEISQE